MNKWLVKSHNTMLFWVFPHPTSKHPPHIKFPSTSPLWKDSIILFLSTYNIKIINRYVSSAGQLIWFITKINNDSDTVRKDRFLDAAVGCKKLMVYHLSITNFANDRTYIWVASYNMLLIVFPYLLIKHETIQQQNRFDSRRIAGLYSS